ncbi:aldehyde dehydrogenase family protein [Trinickia dinghuensis]|uniref:Aldehyde dehydrogenase family protein n=1 Tax=Trinickia dinghuensis TaxID=2291023 RepID=A0A3D8K606_9BURK|nr:aldehyde dehydrogenase family protein [Trinickia dinghuensis]RDV00346.1 aldehyde dehydrogenase family protein [Trinickia dinghuensis]
MSQDFVSVLPEVDDFLQRRHGMFIDGNRVAPQAGRYFDVFDPATGNVLSQVADGDANDAERAVLSAHRAFASGVWSGLRPADRERILLRLVALIEQHAEALAQLETLNQGKSIHLSRAIEVGASIEYARYMAGWSTKLTGETLDVSIPVPPGARYTAYTRREPIGVVAAIVPWNFPLMIAVWKVMPALAAGCTIVLKPAPETPLTALRLAELALEAGVPPGVFNVVTGSGPAVGQALVGSPLVGKVSFTGSTAVGKQVGHAAMDNMTRVTLELGGKNPMIVLDDADLDKTIEGAMMGAFLNQGQVCAAASRLYIQRGRFDAVVDGVEAAMRQLRLGPGMDLAAQVNPLVSERHRRAVSQSIAGGQRQGAELILGGNIPDRPGYFIEPALFVAPSPESALIREEIFGPVLVAIPFDDIDTAIELANDTPYGLAASVWTNDLSMAMNAVPRIQAGTVWVNSHVPVDPNLPFGGYKQSGVGREFGRHAVEGFTELKSICIAH